MLRHRIGATGLTVVALSLAVNSPLRADNFFKKIARGLQYAGWSGTTGDIAISKHLFGDGYNLQTTRNLSDVELYGGIVNLDLQGLNNSTVWLNTDMGFRTWGIPNAKIRLATENATKGGQVVPVQYELTVFGGLQNITVSGFGSMEAELNANLFGFYTLDAYLNNRGELTMTGVDNSTQKLDYDLGPIKVSGNFFVDFLVAVSAPFFNNAGISNPLATFSGLAKMQGQIKRKDDLLARLDAGQTLTDDEMSEIITTSLLESAFGADGSGLLTAARRSLESISGQESAAMVNSLPGFVPEPFSAVCWLAGSGLVALARRRTR